MMNLRANLVYRKSVGVWRVGRCPAHVSVRVMLHAVSVAS